MASKYWIKLYHEILQDPKMGRLPDKLWRRCIELFLVAGEHDQDGYLPEIKDIAWELRVTIEEVEQSLSELSEFGIVALTDSRWLVVKFAERQAPVSSTERSKMSRKFNKEMQRNVAEDATEIKPSRQRTTWMTEIYRNLPTSAGIYAIKCAGSGMVYVGGSVNIQHRIRAHLSEMSIFENHKMYKDLKEFGPESISVQILETVKDEANLREREVYWINQYPFDSLYNAEATGKRNRYWPENNMQRNVAPDKESDTDKESTSKEVGDKSPPAVKVEYTDFQRAFLARFNAKRFKNPTQYQTVCDLTAQYGEPEVESLTVWAANKGMGLGQAIPAIAAALSKPRNGANQNGHQTYQSQKQAGNTPGGQPAGNGAHVYQQSGGLSPTSQAISAALKSKSRGSIGPAGPPLPALPELANPPDRDIPNS